MKTKNLISLRREEQYLLVELLQSHFSTFKTSSAPEARYTAKLAERIHQKVIKLIGAGSEQSK